MTTNQGTKSTLIVTKATDEDSGNYTCSPSSGHSTSVVVHVVDGESWSRDVFITFFIKTQHAHH